MQTANFDSEMPLYLQRLGELLQSGVDRMDGGGCAEEFKGVIVENSTVVVVLMHIIHQPRHGDGENLTVPRDGE